LLEKDPYHTTEINYLFKGQNGSEQYIILQFLSYRKVKVKGRFIGPFFGTAAL
jgi:hypothetical protein